MDISTTARSLLAGLCGSIAHSGLMFLKARAGILPSFQPYEDVQHALGLLVGNAVPAVVPYALSFLNGAVVLGFVFGRIYRLLPGRSGAAKGFVFGLLGWIAMGLMFFPLLGRGLFASQIGLGVQPALFSLLMLLTYGVAMGTAYGLLTSRESMTGLRSPPAARNDDGVT